MARTSSLGTGPRCQSPGSFAPAFLFESPRQWNPSAIVVYEVVMQSVERKFQAIVNAQLVEDAGEMILYGLLCDGELQRDLLVGTPPITRR